MRDRATRPDCVGLPYNQVVWYGGPCLVSGARHVAQSGWTRQVIVHFPKSSEKRAGVGFFVLGLPSSCEKATETTIRSYSEARIAGVGVGYILIVRYRWVMDKV